MGERSVALRRNMTCSPCYLANAADCPRNLACLRLLEPALVYQAAQTLLARPLAEGPARPEQDTAAAPEPPEPHVAANPPRSKGKPRRGAARTRVPA